MHGVSWNCSWVVLVPFFHAAFKFYTCLGVRGLHPDGMLELSHDLVWYCVFWLTSGRLGGFARSRRVLDFFLVRLVNQAHAWSAGYVENVSLILFDPFAFGRYLVVENVWISLAKLASHHRETPSQGAFGISLKAPLLGMYSRWNALCG